MASKKPTMTRKEMIDAKEFIIYLVYHFIPKKRKCPLCCKTSPVEGMFCNYYPKD